MTRASVAAPPQTPDLVVLADAASRCEACDLYLSGTHTVFGRGRPGADVMLVGEQPGDVEDKRGEPFVGPAGKLLDRALTEAGLDRDDLFVTNAVKHFRFKTTERGKRRLHQSPSARHITACRPWLAAEIGAVRPRIVVALGSVAGKSLFGPAFTLTAHRGQRLPWPPEAGPFAGDPTPVEAAFATIHPSAVLRGDEADRQRMFDSLVDDLRLAAAA